MQVNVAGLRRNIKNLAHNYSDAQVKVREATSNDPWGPSAAIMSEIAELTYNVVAFSEIMQMIWKRLNDHGKNWRHVYKALILLEYLIKTGSEKVAQQCKENIFAIQTLREFVYFEEGKDQGTHVREKAKQLVTLLKDDERLKNERVKAQKAKERFAQNPSGFGSDGYIDGPSQRDLPPGWQEEPPKSVSELEMVRPQTAGEEELQLQLAMAMSREEAEQEEAKRRSDDVRLQLALSQSEQDFKDPNGRPIPAPKKEEQQSHLLDLLDISLGATSISSPPLGAAGGAPTAVVDPWAMPGPRAPSQLSDPWSGTSSPQVDPWNPSAAPRTILGAGVPMTSAPLGAGNDAWGARTQSPSVASGSSNEGWLQSNGNANQNGRGATPAGPPAEGWLIKSTAVGALGAAPINHAANNGSSSSDPWLAEPAASAAGGAAAVGLADPWAPGAASQTGAGALDDPWKALGTGAIKKQSPEFDEFDLITNRNKSEHSNSNASNNNNASLLDDMDPLSANYGNGGINSSMHPSTGATAKKSIKDAHSFLGENSALVNLDNLIKPIAPQTQTGNQPAYNPFSDNVVPPKTNLFQQQQPAVPSINQLKQQAPFSVSMNQDPWAPVMGGVSTTSQPQPNLQVYNNAYQSSSSTNILGKSNIPTNMNSSTSNSTIHSCYASPSPGVDGIRNMDIFTERPYYNSPTAPADDTYMYNSRDNNNINSNYGTPSLYSSFAASYSSALSDSLAETPGISVAPLGFVADTVMSFGPSSSSANCKLEQNNNMPWIKPEAATNPFLS
nr:liquid facets, isoform H [Drosophila melanogaster]NP_001261529.1 liquid facets, isoform K [Drosophila melanogaster]NP_729268.2 liquid facets, isoform C [Drosophila melanogaster]AAN12042.2 liquid facets, isoform C [Drosophila melanogaster]AGB94221.1 liquid facets, isoform H [Drosophila melanogaster]AGB94224.1 liquid facets, isoform K [Drosophila melanogaster]|eukprot:NP_001261526.1 liquid facets, isoform H [Drosophila melanogaster]